MSLLSDASLKRIAREIAKYPADQKQSAVMAALAIAQDEHGWLSSEVMEAVAKVLGMAPVAVYEVATFYNMYDLKHSGKVGAFGRSGQSRLRHMTMADAGVDYWKGEE